MTKRFHIMWYEGENKEQAMDSGNSYWAYFQTRKQALKFYNDHKNDPDKFGWWVSHRDADGDVIEDIIY